MRPVPQTNSSRKNFFHYFSFFLTLACVVFGKGPTAQQGNQAEPKASTLPNGDDARKTKQHVGVEDGKR